MESKEVLHRYNTDITNEFFYKYREKIHPSILTKLFYGDDRDLLTKTLNSTKLGLYGAIAMGGLVYSYQKAPPFNHYAAIERSFTHGTPWLIAGIAYGLAVGASAQLRDADGPLNHLFGGIAGGTMLGTWYKSVRFGAGSSVTLVSIGAVCKFLADRDELTPQIVRRPRVFNSYRTGWFTERPNPEGIQDAELDDTYKLYKP
ncbi:unnamed protein product [Lymnaea stagnalis]|uniref:NADH dehydrogenase [ubiquinone] 1 alpha subcomplex subunit 11 n=1 Tax=Lymnaea stagnalis TaxID=6523 RepID=A0AAV2IH20_LYMST